MEMVLPVYMILGLLLILLCVLLLPFFVKPAERNLELFLFVMGILSVTLSGLWSSDLVLEGLSTPVNPKHPIVEVVFISSLIFRYFSRWIHRVVDKTVEFLGLRVFVFLLIVVSGLLSSVITAIIASLVLVQVISQLKLDKRTETNLAVITCFSIGLGAVLTPVGEPLSTIATAKLKGAPYHAGFFFLFNNLWRYILPGVFACGLLGYFSCRENPGHERGLYGDTRIESIRHILERAAKVYVFITALVLLGRGFEPFINVYLIRLHPGILYWINMVSAVLDNATLAAAEISPDMSLLQLRSVLMGLLISGGILIPGNIPNIISAGKLNISSREWAKAGVPLGLVAMVVYFVIIFII